MESINSHINQFKIPLVLSLVGIILIIAGLILPSIKSQPKIYPRESLVESSQHNSPIKVDIAGAVNSPGVYELGGGARIEDVVRSAGGFSDSANQAYISKYLNLSQKVSDGQKIYVPLEGDDQKSMVSINTSVSKVGINSASSEQLDSLPGVGPVTAQKIINARPFNAPEELVIRKVLTKAIYDKLKDLIDLN